MITIVYCCVCLLFVVCHCENTLDSEGYSNDSPYMVEPEVQNIRVKNGTQFSLKCHHKGVIWEYRSCETNYKGLQCEVKNLVGVDKENTWMKLNVTKGRLDVTSSNKSLSGLYRCLEKEIVRKIFIVEIVGPGSYEGTPPHVAPLKTSNLTGQLNMEFTIQCNVTSVIPPTIIWFKKCYGQKCDIEYDKICYCHINKSVTVYNIGNTYLSKYLIFNARDIDSGLYACLAVTEYGKDYKNVFIKVPSSNYKGENESFSLLFLIPFTLILAPVAVWLCYYRRKKKSVIIIVDQQKQLIKPVVRINEEINEVI